MSVSRYYAWLTRFQDAAGGVAHDTGQRTLTVHRRLRADDGTVSGDVLHACMLEALRATGDHTALDVLDAGCGFGGTIFFLQQQVGGRFTGITLNGEQCARATREARRRATSEACRFVVRDYDADLTDLVPDGVDLVIAVESLAHAPDPAQTIARWAARLRPGGRLLVVDDVPRDGLRRNDPDFTAFRDGWLAPAMPNDTALAAALAAAGLEVCQDVDLTPRVHVRRRAALSARIWLTRLASWPAQLTPARLLLDGLHGGLRLERLYQRQVVRYRLIVARAARNAPPGVGPCHT